VRTCIPGRLRRAGLRVALMLAMAALLGRPAGAVPFADVPANHWAYADIQALAAAGLVDGYPDGAFKGDRPLTRYEMAVIVARVIAKINAQGTGTASKADLDKLQKLIDALKDELDALGVRVTNLEDEVASLDRRTSFAQSFAVHGTALGNTSFRQRPTAPQSIVNTTGAPQTPYYTGGVPIPSGASGGVDAFVAAYAGTPDDNDPLQQQIGPQTIVRMDDRFNFIYTVDPNVTISVPVHVVDAGPSGSYDGANQVWVQPDLVIDVAQAGALTNLTFRDAELDNIESSRVGLTYRAPDAAQYGTYGTSEQLFPHGFEIGGIAWGLTDFQATFSRVDQTFLNTQTAVIDPSDGFANNYFSYVTPPQAGYVQVGPPGAASPAGSQTTNAFGPSASALSSAYLSTSAVAGTVYISSYATAAGTSTFNSSGQRTGGTPGGPPAPPAFSYLAGLNEVVFSVPLPPGSAVGVTYVGLSATNNQLPQRYQVTARVNQKFAGLPGAEVGLSFHSLWDENLPISTDDVTTVSPGPNGYPAGSGYGLVSNEVFGIDVALPLAFVHATTKPLVFAEAAASRNTDDALHVAAVQDGAVVVGLRLTLGAVSATLQYQSVGTNYFDGAPLRFYGPAPPTWANYGGAYLPQFFGFANTLAVNQQFDASIDRKLPGASATAGNPALTFIYPIFNPFVATGPDYDSAYTPNTQGLSGTFLTPFTIAGVVVNTRFFAQHLNEIAPNANVTSTFGPQYATAVRATWDAYTLGGTFALPVFGESVAFNMSGTLEHLRRNDPTGYAYVPYNPGTASFDVVSLANVAATGGASAATYYPNDVNLTHTVLVGGAALPLGHNVTFSTRYSNQRYTGSYGTTLGANIDGTKDQFDLGFTYNVPKTTSSVGVAYRNSTYRDATLPSFNLTQNAEDVNFTVRF
jgi:hypothetical protein